MLRQGLRREHVLAVALTWLNRHVYLDTVVLMWEVAARYPGQALEFWAGGSAASLLFFSTLGFGARLLAPVFARPVAWRWLDVAVGMTMWLIAALLLRG